VQLIGLPAASKHVVCLVRGTRACWANAGDVPHPIQATTATISTPPHISLYVCIACPLRHYWNAELPLFPAFLIVYRDPSGHPRLSSAERDYVRAGGATREGPAASGQVAMLGYLLRNRKVWGVTIGFSAYGYSFYLFLTWLPNYLVQSMHMSILKSAGFTAIPWICATIAGLGVGGWLIDHLVAGSYDETRVRKTVLVVGMLLGLAVFGATVTTNPVWAIVWISIALSGLAAASPVGWSIPSLIVPRGGTGTIGGIMNFLNNMMGVVAPVTNGYIVGATGSFVGAFLAAGIVLVIGIVAYVFILGRLEPIADPPA
jgi:ACS family D-galactonate transporter-like MFS transporter